MAKLIKFDPENRQFVRFFSDYVDCGWCEQPTRGRVYEESEQITCSVCKQPLLDMSEDTQYVVEFEPENDDG